MRNFRPCLAASMGTCAGTLSAKSHWLSVPEKFPDATPPPGPKSPKVYEPDTVEPSDENVPVKPLPEALVICRLPAASTVPVQGAVGVVVVAPPADTVPELAY